MACGPSGLASAQTPLRKRNPTVVTLYEIAQGLEVSHVDLVRED
jgi:hypothetical protein